MNTRIHESIREEKGFTLVELAIVMVIIGLLIGGILKGQEMIANAQVTATIAQMKGIDAAASSFRDQYDAFPGDMANASTRLVGCDGTVETCDDGNGDSIIGVSVGDAGDTDDEGSFFFNHLRAADLISGFDGSATYAFGQAIPSASIGGGYMVGDSRTGTTGFTVVRSGVYLVLTGSPVDVADGTGVVSPSQAARIDRKMDDGQAETGSVLADTESACVNSNVYDEIAQDVVCALAVRIQG